MLWAPRMKVAGRLISGTLIAVVTVTGLGKGLSMVSIWDTLFLTCVFSSMVPMTPDGTNLI